MRGRRSPVADRRAAMRGGDPRIGIDALLHARPAIAAR
jgi:hypothetical protein